MEEAGGIIFTVSNTVGNVETMQMRILTTKEVNQDLPMADGIAAMREGYAVLAKREIEMPLLVIA